MATVQVRYIVHDVDAAIATMPEPGGWNRFAIEVSDIAAQVHALRTAGAHLRDDIVVGVGGKQSLLEDPSGNPIEVFEPTTAEAQQDHADKAGRTQCN